MPNPTALSGRAAFCGVVPGVKTPGSVLLPLRGTKLECRHPSFGGRLPGVKPLAQAFLPLQGRNRCRLRGKVDHRAIPNHTAAVNRLYGYMFASAQIFVSIRGFSSSLNAGHRRVLN
jgi:hypothetical protein